jgi:predicted nucleic acid-binding protein
MTPPLDRDPTFDFLDTNPVLRYLLGDHPDHFARSQALIESDRPFRLSIVTLAEAAYVLTRVAGVSRPDALDTLVDLLNRENIRTHEVDTDVAIRALRQCRPSGRVNFADAMLWAVARVAAPARVWTFDEYFPEDGIEARRP